MTIAAGANPVAVLFDSISATGLYTIYRNASKDFGYIGSAGVLNTGGSVTDLSIRSAQNLILSSGSGEDMRIATNGFVGIATTSPYAPLSVVGFGGVVASNYTATSTTATSTFAGGVDFRTATVQQKSTYIINISTTSPSWATSTKIFPTTTLQTWNSITCFTDTGTLNVAITNNGNPVNTVSATSTVSTFALTQNNRFVPGSKVNFSVGTPVSTPSQIGCAIDYISNI